MSNVQSHYPIKTEHISTGETVIHKNQRECSEWLKCNRITIIRLLKGRRKGVIAKANIIGEYKVSYDRI